MSTETNRPDPKQPKDPKVDQLLREGLAAIKLKDNVSARAKLQEVVALDQYNEQGWYWLASVVETDEERRVCLGNVVVINPKNERAQMMLERLSGNPNAGLIPRGDVQDATASGIWRMEGGKRGLDRRVILIGVGILALLVVVVALFALGGGGGSPQPVPTLAVLAGTNAATTVALAATGTQATTGSAGPATAAGTMAGTVDVNAPPPTLPPTWTPMPTGGAVRSTALPPPPPALTGRLVAIQGNFISSATNLSIVVMDPSGKNVRQVSQANDVGDYGILMPDGQRLIYARFVASTNAQTLRVSFSNGTRSIELSSLWGNEPPLSNVRMPSVSRNGTVLAFSAANLIENDNTPDIYTVPTRLMPPAGTESDSGDAAVTATEGTQQPTKAVKMTATPTPVEPTATPGGPIAKVKRLTPKDSGINTWPSVSPDGSKIVYVSDTKPLGTDGTDLYVIGANGGAATNLTNDLTDNTEAAPEWSTDGTRIAYQVMAKGSKNNGIFIMDATGKNKIELIAATSDNIRPHWSPDGQFIAFSSNRDGSKYDIFIVNVQSKQMFQVTQGTVNTICTNWGPK